MGTKFQLLRSGKPRHKIIQIRGVDVAVVMLPASDTRRINEQAELWARQNRDIANEQTRDAYLNCLLAFECLRDPDNFQDKIAASLDELIGNEVRNIETGEIITPADPNGLTIQEIMNIVEAYGELAVNSMPTIDMMTEAEFDDLKKSFEGISMSDLSSVSLVHLVNFRASLTR